MPTVGEEQKKPPILQLGDVRLRPLRTSDAPALLAYLSDPRVIEHAVSQSPLLNQWRRPSRATWLRIAKARPFGLHSHRPTIASLAFAASIVGPLCTVTRSLHTNLPITGAVGCMRAAVIALLRWGFSELNLNRVHAFVMTSNTRSTQLLDHCGFTRGARCGNTASHAGCRRTSTSSRFSLKSSPATKRARRLTNRWKAINQGKSV